MRENRTSGSVRGAPGNRRSYRERRNTTKTGMHMKESTLLELDGIGNVLLGLPLVVYPTGVAQLLGIPFADAAFYPIILGAVFIGIGLALLVERFSTRVKGLGLGGALSINLTFGVVLGIWLLASRVDLPMRGSILLWLLVVVLVGISVFEWFSVARKASA